MEVTLFVSGVLWGMALMGFLVTVFILINGLPPLDRGRKRRD